MGVPLEAVRQVGRGVGVVGEELDGHVPVQVAVASRPHLAHSAATEPLDQLVPARDQRAAIHPPPLTCAPLPS
ncbi:hypothetical protein [Actinomadura sp. NPDC000600]|uniref:hypothetical protein n=1 Tax=Actinomadura sp. NPDC000600 TaxID=3154262 RepID=UPI0033945373